MSRRNVIGLSAMLVIALWVSAANAIICPSSPFKCDLNRDGLRNETCRYTACSGSCCLSPASVLVQMSANQLNNNQQGDTVEAVISALPSPPLAVSSMSGLVLCATKSGNDPWGSVEAELSGSLTLVGQANNINVVGATSAATFEAVLGEPALRSLDQFCNGHVAVDFIPFSFTLILSIINPDGTVDSGNNSIAAACVHPDPDSVGLVTKGRNKGAITGGPYDCDLCPFIDANNDGIADVAGCASCLNSDGSLNGSCPVLGK